MPPSISMNAPSMHVPPPPGSQFACSYASSPNLCSSSCTPTYHTYDASVAVASRNASTTTTEEAPPPLPDEPEPKRQKLDDSFLIPDDQFLAQHPGPVRISVFVPNVEEGNLKGQLLEITVQSL
ncbi:hypothetical protein F2P56_036645 [Juglans regia]|uniref:Uncharacterized protein n=2 Tax=Juglans regia TaxID=51240 RepID=A0A833X779_JUGRE|nr:probable splicing factor 3A subunit 1 [Juglans regia]KAF5444145.1 hypothetical protein F2P56_036645 [Juglans regia]